MSIPSCRSIVPLGCLILTILTISALFSPNRPTHVLNFADGTADPTSIAPAAGSPSGTYFDHLVFIIMENEGIDNICGMAKLPPCQGSNSPFMSSLANNYTIGTQYLSLVGTSQPNYVGILAASIQNCTSSCGAGSLHAVNLVDRFESAGLTWKGYMENQNPTAGCDTSDHSPYNTAHNPFIPFNDIRTNPSRCNKIILANPALNSTCTVADCALINDLNSASAPNFLWVTPNDCNNMHASSGCANMCTSAGSSTCIEDGDDYLESVVPNILKSYTFQHDRSALFVTFDEGQGFCPNNNNPNEDCMYAVWAGPQAKTGSFVTSNKYNHYSFTKTIEVNWNLPTMTSNDAGASAMTEFFQTQPPDFSTSASPSSITDLKGAKSNSTITLTSLNAFTGTITLTATSSPTGPTLNLTPSSVTLTSGGTGTSTLSITTIATGNYSITVQGTSGPLSHNTNVSLKVQDFTISANPTSLKIIAGANSSSSIGIAAINHFSSTVSLTVTSSAGLTASVRPSSIQGAGTAMLTGTSPTSGNYTATVVGTSGNLSHNVTVSVQVVDFSISSTTPVTINQGHGTTLNITITSLNGFNQQVSLTANVSPQLNCGPITPSVITRSGLVTVFCLSDFPGTFDVNVTGTSGTSSHSITIVLNVSAAVGGTMVPPNKLALALQYSPTLTLLLLSVTLGTVLWTRRRK